MPSRFLLVAALVIGCPRAGRDTAPPPAELIPRALLFSDAERAQVRISPDGAQLAFLAPHEGVLRVWVAPRGQPDQARPLVARRASRTSDLEWAGDSRHVLLMHDEIGKEAPHLHSLDVTTGEAKDLTPTPGVQPKLLRISHSRPTEVALGLNERDRRLPDLYAVDIVSGERKLIAENKGYTALIVDDALRLRVVGRDTPTGGYEFLRWNAAAEPTSLLTWSADDRVAAYIGIDGSGRWLYVGDVRGRDKAALVQVEIDSSKTELIAEDAAADISEVVAEPSTGKPEAASANYTRKRWHVLSTDAQPHFDLLARELSGDFSIVSRSRDGRYWVISHDQDVQPLSYHLYDKHDRKLVRLFSTRPALERVQLSHVLTETVRARDGLPLVVYLTLPSVPAAQPPPLVVWIHGGPWDRDAWGFYAMDQLLANRGYAVMRLNFRGSTGLGKAFINAANQQWAGTMQTDVEDAVRWASSKGHIDGARVAIAGGSYGGYAALIAMSQTPEAYRCGISRSGIPDLVPYFGGSTGYRGNFADLIAARVFDPRTEEGRAELSARSPITHVDKLARPLLVFHGEQDPRIRTEDIARYVDAAHARGASVTFATFPDEGHAYARPQNLLAFYGVMEAFLASCLGGRAEPLGGELRASSIKLRQTDPKLALEP